MTENGLSVPKESEMPLAEALDDKMRVDYLKVRSEWGDVYMCLSLFFG